MIDRSLTNLKVFAILTLSCLKIPGRSYQVIENAILN